MQKETLSIDVRGKGDDVYLLCLCALGNDMCAISQYQKMWLCPTSYSAYSIVMDHVRSCGCTLDDFALFYMNTGLLVYRPCRPAVFNAVKLNIRKEFEKWLKRS